MAGVFRPSVLLVIICFYRVVLSDEQKRDSLQCQADQKPCVAVKRCILKTDKCPPCAEGEEHCDPRGDPTAAFSHPPSGEKHSREFSSPPPGEKHSREFSHPPPGEKHSREFSHPPTAPSGEKHSREFSHPPTTPSGEKHSREFSRPPPGEKHSREFSHPPPGEKHSREFSSRPPGEKHSREFSHPPPGEKHSREFSHPPPGEKHSREFSHPPSGEKHSREFSHPPPGEKHSREFSRKSSGKPGGKEVCPDGQSDCVPKPSRRPPKKGEYIFIGSIFPNKENPGRVLKDVLKDLGSSSATVEGVLNNVNGTWQVRRLKPDARKKIEWVDLNKGMKISGKDKLRFKPSVHRAHGFDGIELKINNASKYIGILVNPCVMPKLVVKKKVLSGTEDTLLRFHLDQVVNVTRSIRARPKALRSKLVEQYKHAIPKGALDEYERLLKQHLGRNLGLLVWPSRHGEVEERSERSKNESKPVKKPPSRDRIVEHKPKIFPIGSSLVFKPNDDYFGTVELKVVPVDVSPNIKDLRTVRDRCAFGNDSIISIEIANVNDKPTARRDPRTRNKPKLVINAPPLRYELKNHSDNEGFKVGDLAMKAGEDKDLDRLGIAVVVANKKKQIGEWQYLDRNNAWQSINVSGRVNDDASIVGENAQLLFLPPGQSIRFKPSELTKLWSATEQMLHTPLRFILWDQTDDLKFGVHSVTLKGNSAISAKVITCTIGRMGCDGIKNSRKKKNECRKCGEKSCKKCDGDLESSAKLNACGHCVLGKTGMGKKHGMDCMGICNGTYIRGKCGCRKSGDVAVDCAGTCGGAARRQKCGACSKDEDAGKDACGVCNGDNSTCLGCDEVPNSRKVFDICKACRSPKSPDFNTGCVSIGHVSPKSFAKGVEQELKVGGAGFPEKGIQCELRSSGIKVTASRVLFETSKSMKLSMPAINGVGKYKLSCTIGGVVHTKENFTVAVYDKQELTVTKVEPNEIDVGSGVTEVLVTGTGFMDTGDLFCVYKAVGEEKADVTVPSRFRLATKAKETFQRSCEKPPKRARAKFISSTQVKCKVSAKTCPGRVNISVVLSQGGRPESSVRLTWYARAPAIVRHFMGVHSSTLIHIIFNRSVAKVVGCDKIFSEVTVTKLAELVDRGKPRCYFRKPDELVIAWRGDDMKTDINLKFKRRVIKADAAFSRTSPLELTVQAVVKKVVPIAVITAPSQVALCGKIKISGKNSKKTGRKVFRCKWTVNVSNEDALSEEAKTDLANVRNRAQGCVFTIEKHLKQGIRYTFILVVESMGVESEPASHVVERLEKNVPSVRFVKKLGTFDMAKRKLTIRVRAKKPNCLRDSAVKFLWNCTSHPDLELGADKKNVLALPRKRLECGTTYVFNVRVYMASNTQLFTVLTHSVTTKGTRLKFIIDGGDRVIAANDIIQLKASPVNRVTCGGKLVYVFSCAAEDGEACLVTNSQGERKSFEPRGGEKPSIRVKANQFRVNETYTFKVEVSKTGKQKTESFESSVKITIVSGSPPIVRLKTATHGKKKIIIAEVKTSFKKTKFKWECVEESGYGLVDLSNMKRGKGVINRPEGRGQKSYAKKLLLLFDSTALEAGVPYKIRLIAYPDQALDNVGESTVTIRTNAPPTQGELDAVPKVGLSHNTTFSLTAVNFYDNSTISYKFSYEKRDKSGVVKKKPLPFKGERSTEVQLPSGDDADDGSITLVVEARDEKGATTSARTGIKCRRKQLNSEDVDKQIDALNDLTEEGDPKDALALGVSLSSDLAEQPKVQEKNSELQESLTEAAKNAMEQADGTSEKKIIMELLPFVRPPTEESKRELSSSLTDLVTGVVPKDVKRQGRPEQTEETRSSRRRRAAEEESNADEEDEESSGMTSEEMFIPNPYQQRNIQGVDKRKWPSLEVENVLATFENLVDTTVVNNVTRDFLETVDNLLIAMCKDLPLGETSIALSSLGTLRSDMNYMDDVDQVFRNVSCSNCSSLINRTALVKLGSGLKSLYNEWNCSGGEELCNGVCVGMVQYPYDFITADNSSTRRSDVVFMELKNPETLDHIPIEGLVQPAVLRIPLHPGSFENAGYECKIWDNSVAQWSTSGCQKTQVFSQDETVFVDCNCTRLGFTVVHAVEGGEGGGGGGGGTTTTDLSTEPSTAQSSTSGTGTGTQTTGTQTTESPRLTASVTFSFDVNYNSVVKDASIKDQLENTVEQTLADVMHVDMSLILNITISPGSIVVNFILLSPLQNPSVSLNYSISQLQLAVNNGGFIVTLSDGVQITADNGTVGYSYRMVSGIQPDPVITKTKDDDEEDSKLPLILGCVFGVLLLVVVVVFILYRSHVVKQSKVSHQDIRMGQPIENNCAENTGYQGSVGKDLGEGTPQTTSHDGSEPSTAMEETAEPEARRPSTAGSRVGSGGVRRKAELPGVE